MSAIGVMRQVDEETLHKGCLCAPRFREIFSASTFSGAEEHRPCLPGVANCIQPYTLPGRRFSRSLESVEVHFTPETEKKLKDLSAQSGRLIDDFVEDATAAYVDELLRTRDMLNSRYDDLKSGRVKPIDGEEAFARLKAKTEAQRNPPA